MRFLANENFPGAAVTALEAAGHDVVWVRIAAPGTSDPEVLVAAPSPAGCVVRRSFGDARPSTLLLELRQQAALRSRA
jgi:hypothetical protein